MRVRLLCDFDRSRSVPRLSSNSSLIVRHSQREADRIRIVRGSGDDPSVYDAVSISARPQVERGSQLRTFGEDRREEQTAAEVPKRDFTWDEVSWTSV